MDVLTPAQRRLNMSRIKSKNTTPELIVRRWLHGHGYRYHLHVSDLPGKPDIVFRSRRLVIFVNGCFWHSHSCRYGSVVPATNAEFWSKKRNATKYRDALKQEQLEDKGWAVVSIWECETKDQLKLEERLGKLWP